jgi:hypothetical protein
MAGGGDCRNSQKIPRPKLSDNSVGFKTKITEIRKWSSRNLKCFPWSVVQELHSGMARQLVFLGSLDPGDWL